VDVDEDVDRGVVVDGERIGAELVGRTGAVGDELVDTESFSVSLDRKRVEEAAASVVDELRSTVDVAAELDNDRVATELVRSSSPTIGGKQQTKIKF
jgi:hypothetical protein